MKKAILFLSVMLLPTVNAFALDRCEASFRRGLSEMKSYFDRLGPACKREVNLGEANESRIRAVCNADERGNALAMKNVKLSTLKPLCQDSECDRLRERGVCVDGKPFSYYLGKFGM